MKVLGLDICADTVVGSDMNRGVSGGQRKRVTTGIPAHTLSCSYTCFTFYILILGHLEDSSKHEVILRYWLK